jgi:hypothetical protein
MQESLVNALRCQSTHIRERWAALLHVEPVTTPLANPDVLAYLIDPTLTEIFQNLTSRPSRQRLGRRAANASPGRGCCGQNPLLAYFSAGQQVMREALILVQAAMPLLDPAERDASLEELNAVLNHIARREIVAFCGVCQFRREPFGHRTNLGGAGAPAVVSFESAAT